MLLILSKTQRGTNVIMCCIFLTALYFTSLYELAYRTFKMQCIVLEPVIPYI